MWKIVLLAIILAVVAFIVMKNRGCGCGCEKAKKDEQK